MVKNGKDLTQSAILPRLFTSIHTYTTHIHTVQGGNMQSEYVQLATTVSASDFSTLLPGEGVPSWR